MNTSATQTTTNEAVNSQVGVNTISKGSIALIGGASAIIGLWAVSCLVSATFIAGPLAVATGWFTAITGL